MSKVGDRLYLVKNSTKVVEFNINNNQTREVINSTYATNITGIKKISPNKIIINDQINGLILLQTDKNDVEYISLPQNAGKVRTFTSFVVYSWANQVRVFSVVLAATLGLAMIF